MSRYRKWIVSLGLAAATPAVAWSGPFSFLNPGGAKHETVTTAGANAPGVSPNQQTAEAIASALRGAKLNGQDIEIEFKNGVAKLTGRIADVRQKAQATQVLRSVPGVHAVDNQLELLEKPQFAKSRFAPAATAQMPQFGANQLAPYQAPGIPSGDPYAAAGLQPQLPGALQLVGGAPGPQPLNPAQMQSSAAIYDNNEVANQIAGALSDSGLSGYDIEIRHQNGTTQLVGSVATVQERMAATQVVQRIPGVQRVDNQLLVDGQADPAASYAGPAAPPAMPLPVVPFNAQQAGYPPHPAMVNPAAYYQNGQAAIAPIPPGGPASAPYAIMNAGESPVYNSPHLPDHAWPAYAAYPNSAAVTYPQQYSASAWPYIGPFYPYPQIPLGWRKAQLEWDDGYWNLNFNPRTDKWWWFLHPDNWD